MKKFATALLIGLLIFLVLPLGIQEYNDSSGDPSCCETLELPAPQTNFYPAFVTIWRQYEMAGLLPPYVWRFNNANLLLNSVLSLSFSVFVYKKFLMKK